MTALDHLLVPEVRGQNLLGQGRGDLAPLAAVFHNHGHGHLGVIKGRIGYEQGMVLEPANILAGFFFFQLPDKKRSCDSQRKEK